MTTTTAATTTTTTTMTTEAPTVAEETVVLFTGGFTSGGFASRLSSSEIYPTGCSLPALPFTINGHSTFATTGPNSKIVTCGGHNTQGKSASCLVLDVENQLWDETLMGDLPEHRSSAASATIENIGTYLMGGYPTIYPSILKRTSDFLEAGSTEWTAGPAIPVDMDRPCAVSISQLSFLIISGSDILEYQVDTTNPTSSSGWQSASKFPQLQTSRSNKPGCSKIGDKVVIAGGQDGSGYLRSAEVLHLTTRTIVYAGDLNSPRAYLRMATITMNGEQTLFAFGGFSGPALNSVEHFNTNNNTWTFASTGMVEARWSFAAVALPREILCPT